MGAKVGDQILIGGGQAASGRVCEVLEIRTENGPPWSDGTTRGGKFF